MVVLKKSHVELKINEAIEALVLPAKRNAR